jgi:glycosyltransferase involved in cell wall biosynthesis
MAKTLLVTKSYPPVVGGSAFLLYELTRHFKSEDLVVVHGINDPPVNSNQRLPFKRKQVLFFGSGINTLRFNRYLPKWYIKLIRLQVRRAIRKNKVNSIYIHYPNGAFAVAAYLEAKRAKIPYIFYQDILWEEREKGAELELAREFEAKVIAHATHCIAITEFAAAHQAEKHGRPFHTIPHTLDIANVPEGISKTNNQKKRIHFAGGIYPRMNEDSVLRFMEACKLLPFEFEFEFCSPDVPKSLKDYNIEWKYLSKEKLLEAQSTCDLLFLPQAFESSTASMIRHNFPTKTMEYLCSGRPILVHSPADSYLSDLCANMGFGMLVDQPDVKQLAQAIEDLLSDYDLQESYVNKAIALAKERNSEIWFKELDSILAESRS